MGSVQRWYVYLVSAVTIQAVTWAAISLFRNLIIPGIEAPVTAIAFQLSVIVIGLPLFLVHWLWAQRKAEADLEERASFPRLLYLYIMMAAFLAPLVNNVFRLIQSLLYLAFDVTPTDNFVGLTPVQDVWYNLAAAVILASLWFYHWRVRVADEKTVPANDVSSIVRQLYIYLFTIIGLVMSTLGIINLLQWLMTQLIPVGLSTSLGGVLLAGDIARVLVGLPLWLLFWIYAQRLFHGPDEQERESIVRKVYLYLVVFAAVMAVVSTTTIVLADLFKRLFDVPASGGDIRLPLSIIVVNGVVWAYHAFVLRQDAILAGEKQQQAAVRRIYLYLLAGIGLAAMLVGLGGVLSVLIRALASADFILNLREQLAWFTATLIAGLPIWLISWRRIQIVAGQPGSEGQEERRSAVRRIYLYFFIFAATMTILSGSTYLLTQIIGLALGARSSINLFRDIGQALSFILIAVAVWLYHGSILRRENRLTKQEEAEQLKPLRVVIIDDGDGRLGQTLVEQLHKKVPSAKVQPVGLSSTAGTVMNSSIQKEELAEVLGGADVIVGPWHMAVAGSAGGLVSESIAHSIATSPAYKVLIPVRDEGWEWTGVERWKVETIVKEVTTTVKQLAIGKDAKPKRRLGTVSIVLIVFLVLCLLLQIVPIIMSLIFFPGF